MELPITKEELGVLRFAVSLAMDVVSGWHHYNDAAMRLEALHKKLLEVKDNG
jgi:hypothetical protein